MLGASIIFFGFCLIISAFIIMSVRIFQVKPDFIKKILKYSVIVVFTIVFSFISVFLGYRIENRHSSSKRKGYYAVRGIWGGSIYQGSPSFFYEKKFLREYLNPKTGKKEKQILTRKSKSSFLKQKLFVESMISIRKKGILKYPGYKIKVKALFEVKNNLTKNEIFFFNFPLPERTGNLKDFTVLLEGKPYIADQSFSDGVQWKGVLKPGEKKSFQISYQARGSGRFQYGLKRKKQEIENFSFSLESDYKEIRIPDSAMAPVSNLSTEKGSHLKWDSKKIITGQDISFRFELKDYANLASKLFFYAPLALILFIGLIIIIAVGRSLDLHLMHYLFFLIAFFLFYPLNSYLLSFLPTMIALSASLIVSCFMVLYYSILIKKGKDLIKSAAIATFVFQWIFSASFFFPRFTGLIITISFILSFIFLMKLTANIEWKKKW